MTTFMIGLVVGFLLFAIAVSVNLFNKIQVKLVELVTVVDHMQKILPIIIGRLTKIEQMTQATMQAAETFVDGLRDSAEQMQHMRQSPDESFDDLRQSFEDGIKNMEEGFDERDEDSDEPDEPWKKK